MIKDTGIPPFRIPTMVAWDEIFKHQTNCRPRILVHGVPIEFSVPDHQSKIMLEDYFPSDWKTTEPTTLKVDWRSPVKELLRGYDWHEIASPDCHFSGPFVSQRDFFAKKIDDQNFQLISPLEMDDGIFNFLRFVLPWKLLEKNQVLFHSSCVIDENENAYLFFGPSGAGKTTIASLCSGETLGDDMNILSFEGQKLQVEGAALGQRFFSKKSFGKKFPVVAAFWLNQGPSFAHQLFDGGELKYLLSSFANLFWDQMDQEKYSDVFALAAQIKSSIPIYDLTFSKTEEVWSYVQSIVKQGLSEKQKSTLAEH